jgi:hypothetical protein
MTEQQHLNAGQLQQIQRQASEALQVAVDKMQLRKWAVEQAFTVCSSINNSRHPGEKPQVGPQDAMVLATAVYDFVSQAAAVRVELPGGGK